MPGAFCLMLHSHIPYCKKSGVWPAGEEWLFEAMNECYIPLLIVLRRLLLEGIRPGITIGVVPILAEQLADGYLKARFLEYMGEKILRAQHDRERFADDPARAHVAEYWHSRFEEHVRAYAKDFHQDILGTLKWLQDEGAVEVITSAATHGFLPLMKQDSAVYAQVRIGVETYEKHFGKRPRGFWLPECAYRPAVDEKGRRRKGIDEWLADFGIEYFIVEGTGITTARIVGNDVGVAPSTDWGWRLASGVSVFGRNAATGSQVWSAAVGYPSAPDYLEFHWKDPETGLNYHRVTGKDQKDVYVPAAAAKRVKKDAAHFVRLLATEMKRARAAGTQAPVVCSPYDTELFGHWWHEGPAFIEEVCRNLAAGKAGIVPETLSVSTQKGRDKFATIQMGQTSWGENGDFTVWQNPEHGWIWPLINDSCVKMEGLLAKVEAAGGPQDDRDVRILRQMARELLLMQGSDWPFLLYTEQAREYANQRFHHHHQRFLKLRWAVEDLNDRGRVSDHDLAEMEAIDGVWGEIEYNYFKEYKD